MMNGVPPISRARPTEYQEFCVVQSLRGKLFVTAAVTIVAIVVAVAALAYYLVVR